MGDKTVKLASVRCEDLSAFAPVMDALDSCYWFIETQGGYLPDPDDEMAGHWLEIDCDGDLAFGVDVGCFSKILQRLVLDEWTCFTGVRCSRDQLSLAAKAYLNLKQDWLEGAHVALVVEWDGLLAVYPDGWWEIVSSDQGLLEAVCKGRANRIVDLADHRIGENPQS